MPALDAHQHAACKQLQVVCSLTVQALQTTIMAQLASGSLHQPNPCWPQSASQSLKLKPLGTLCVCSNAPIWAARSQNYLQSCLASTQAFRQLHQPRALWKWPSPQTPASATMGSLLRGARYTFVLLDLTCAQWWHCRQNTYTVWKLPCIFAFYVQIENNCISFKQKYLIHKPS